MSRKYVQICEAAVEQHPDSTVVAYYYNGDGLKVIEDDGVEQTLYVYDGNNLLQEQSVYGTVAEFTYVPAPYAQALSQKREGDSSFFHGDGMSIVTVLTDAWQIITDEYTYDAWGKLRNAYGTTANSQLFKGEHLAYRQDPNAGPDALFALHHRHYASEIGRFTSEDPAADDLNLYRYVGNNPVNAADPSGLGPHELPVELQQYLKSIERGGPRIQGPPQATPPDLFNPANVTESAISITQHFQQILRSGQGRLSQQKKRERERARLEVENRYLRQEELSWGRLKGGMEATLGGLQIAGAGIGAYLSAPFSVPAAALAYGLAGAEVLRGADVGITGILNASDPDTEYKTLTNQGIAAATGSQEAGDLGETIVDVTLAGANLAQGAYGAARYAKGKLLPSAGESTAEVLDDLANNTPNVKNAPEVKPAESVPSAKGDARSNSGPATSKPLTGNAVDSIPSVRNDEFNRWFNKLTPDELDEIWKNPKLRDAIEDRLRHPGGLHEWHLVARTPTFKRWGLTADQIKEMRTLIKDTEFVNPVGRHGGKGSTVAHNELLEIIDSSTNYEQFVRRLQNWANYRLKGGARASASKWSGVIVAASRV